MWLRECWRGGGVRVGTREKGREGERGLECGGYLERPCLINIIVVVVPSARRKHIPPSLRRLCSPRSLRSRRNTAWAALANVYPNNMVASTQITNILGLHGMSPPYSQLPTCRLRRRPPRSLSLALRSSQPFSISLRAAQPFSLSLRRQPFSPSHATAGNAPANHAPPVLNV